jgi:hypothetical protein
MNRHDDEPHLLPVSAAFTNFLWWVLVLILLASLFLAGCNCSKFTHGVNSNAAENDLRRAQR